MKANKTYYLEKVSKGNYLIIVKNYSRLDEILPLVSLDLKSSNAKGNVVFDTLLTNGNNSNRFISAFFDGKGFVLPTIKKTSPDQVLLSRITSFLKQHINLLSEGILTKNEILRIQGSLQ